MSAAVAIAGGGPVGLMLAIELRIAGIEAIVLERRESPSPWSKALAISPRSVEILDQRGLLGPFLEKGSIWPKGQFAAIRLDFTRLDCRRRHAIMIIQTHVERILEEAATRLGADIRRGHDVAGFRQDPDGVVVEVRSARTERLRVDYLVGCDGANSTVRKLAGIGFPGTDPEVYALLGDVESVPESFEQRLPLLFPGGMFGLAPLEPGRFRVATAELGVPPPDPDAPVSVEELHTSIRRVTGLDIKLGKPLWLSRFTDVTRQAERYREGRVFLAGDAAHIHFPLSGQGMNLGLHDAVNLGWKLAGAIHGWAPPDLLSTYHTERHPVGERVCLNTRAQIALSLPLNRVSPLRDLVAELIGQQENVHDYLARMVAGLEACYPMAKADPHPLLGRRMPDIDLVISADGVARTATLAEHLHRGRGLVLDLSRGAIPLGDLTGWADRVDVVTAAPVPGLGVAAAVIRPDGHVAWARADGTGAGGLRSALATWFGRPSEPGRQGQAVRAGGSEW
jgi:2-polyprenyl-6-methoxyphenol hydroxylase-like FAD-dependent oxidoreductase